MDLGPVEKAMHAVADKIAERAKETDDAEELETLASAVSDLAYGPTGGNHDTDYTYNASIDNHQHHHAEGERRGAGFGS